MLSKIVCAYSRMLLKTMNINVIVEGREELPLEDKNVLIVSNHVSYLDVLVLCSVFPSVFISSVETLESPFMGLLADLGGTLFVERRSKEKLKSEIDDVTEGLRAGLNIVLFPEATSTNGDRVHDFKRMLLSAAVKAEVGVLPVTLNYFGVDGEALTVANRDKIFWYGDMTFFGHLKGLLGCRSIDVRLSLGRARPTALGMDTKLFATELHRAVSDRYRPPISLG